jgi:voltage-gated potassium channel
MRFYITIKDQIYVFITIIVGIIIFGVAGYMIIENWSFIDSLYMTTITIATVGYSEVNGLSESGKIFTIILIIISFGNFAFAITSLTKYVVGGEYKVYLKEKKVQRTLKKMKEHIIVCGYGRVGKQVVNDLSKQHKNVIVIELDTQLADAQKTNERFQFIIGDGTKDEVLRNAGIEKAASLVTCLPKDADNLYIVLAAKELNKAISIVARANNNDAVSKLKLAGADHVVMPDSIGGSQMASLIATPMVAEFLELISINGDSEVNIECLNFADIPHAFQNKQIGLLDAEHHSGVNIIGFRKNNGELIVNPSNEMQLTIGTQLFVLGTKDQIKKLDQFLRDNP